MRLAAISLAAFLAASCTRAPAPVLERFPIGMYGVRQVAEVDARAKEGFDTFVAEADAETITAMGVRARRHGMKLMAHPAAFQKAGPAPAGLPIDAWYAYAEPDVQGLSSATVAAGGAAIKAWDTRTPVTIVLGQGSSAMKYAGIGDALMLGWSSAPRLAIGTAADEIDKAYWFTGGRPLWFIVLRRLMDHVELRAVSYLAVVHGAKGLFYAEVSDATARMAREMRAMQPIFSANRRVPLPFEPSPGGVEAACWRWRGRDYLVLVNRHPDKQLKVPAPLLDRSWRPLFELRRDPKELLKEFRGSHYLPPLRVLVLESRIQWRDLFGLSRTRRTP